jgi:hypothetical protein
MLGAITVTDDPIDESLLAQFDELRTCLAELCSGLERNEGRPADDDRLVDGGDLGARDDVSAEYIGVDDDRSSCL